MAETRILRPQLCWISAGLLIMLLLLAAQSLTAAVRGSDTRTAPPRASAVRQAKATEVASTAGPGLQAAKVGLESPAESKNAPASTSLGGLSLQIRGAFGSGGGQGAGNGVNVSGVFGQVIAGKIGTTTIIHQGFWLGYGQPSCCIDKRGNLRSEPGDFVDISDLQGMIDLLFFGGPLGVCPEESDVDGLGTTDITDLQLLVGYLFLGEELVDCP